MKRYVVVSTNNNPEYMFYAPYIEKAWNSLGWDLCVMVTSDVNHDDLKLSNPETKVITVADIPGLRKESIAQVSRLYAGRYFEPSTLLMTSDMDLLPLSDYWNPNPEEITVYGHDLTDYTYFPMGYIAMSARQWQLNMGHHSEVEHDILVDADIYKEYAYAADWEKWWNWDWAMITDVLKDHENIIHIKRGRRLTGTYAYGRIDRGDSMKIPPNEKLIDAHCENVNVQHPDKLNKFLSIFESHYGKL